MKKALVFQHIAVEDLGFFKNLLLKDSFHIDYVKFYKNQSIPKDLENYSLMISLGGPMDTWMVKKYPWLISQKLAIEKFVLEMQRPFIGLCLGCQLLGEVLGGKIVHSQIPEIGFMDVKLSDKGKKDKILNNFPEKFKVFQWHSYEVNNLKSKDIKILAYTSNTPIQLFKFKNHAFGIQFHLEIQSNTILNWLTNKIYKRSLIKKFGINAIKKLEKDQKLYLKKTNLLCTKLFNNLKNNFLLM